MLTTTASELETRKAIALRSIEIMATGTREDFAEVLHSEFFNHEQRDEPPGTRGPGPDETYGVAEWLRTAYADLRWDVHDVVAENDLVVVRCPMSGRHVGDSVAYDLDGRVADAFAPTGRRFATTQSHWLRIREGQARRALGQPRRPPAWPSSSGGRRATRCAADAQDGAKPRLQRL